LARFITAQTLSFRDVDSTKSTFLEPCSGTGNFVIAYIDEVLKGSKAAKKEYIQKIINNIYCADIDKDAIELLKRIIPAYIKRKYGVSIKIPAKNFFAGNILFEINGSNIKKNDPKSIFKVKNGFDIVITNPPYGLLKANSNKYGEKSNNKASFKHLTDYLKKQNIYPLSEGTLNYYKIFVEEIVSNYTHPLSLIGLLIPRTILNDRHSQRLRGEIFEKYEIDTIYTIPERNDFFPDVAQAFCFFSINKTSKGRQISIVDGVRNENDFNRKAVRITIPELKAISSSIIAESDMGMRILKKLHKNPRLGSLMGVVNLRGELDLTFHKNYIVREKTKYPLVKGINIKEFSLSPSREYIAEDFLSAINGKQQYVVSPRIVCQQISNIHSRKRLKFAFVDVNYILGNSCNFLALRNETGLFGEPEISLYYLLGILNSVLLDWRFRVSNSNNHVANYELSELPIILSGEKQLMKSIEQLSFALSSKYEPKSFCELNKLVLKLYNLDKEESAYVLSQYPQLQLEGIK
jgi:Alw26I/Eco31I/Esp3I family type II restriction m6 adenine DNA methyltransferase